MTSQQLKSIKAAATGLLKSERRCRVLINEKWENLRSQVQAVAGKKPFKCCHVEEVWQAGLKELVGDYYRNLPHAMEYTNRAQVSKRTRKWIKNRVGFKHTLMKMAADCICLAVFSSTVVLALTISSSFSG